MLLRVMVALIMHVVVVIEQIDHCNQEQDDFNKVRSRKDLCPMNDTLFLAREGC